MRGAFRYTDKATGRPVIDFPKEMVGAYYGLPSSKTAKRAVSRWNQGAMNQGKGDMPRPQTPVQKKRADDSWLTAFCTRFTQADPSCACFECRRRRIYG